MSGSSSSNQTFRAWRLRARNLPRRRQRTFVTAMLVLAAAFWFAMGASVLYAHQVFDGIPQRETISRVTQMARSSVFYDVKGRPAFTIFKEQRLEVPLDKMSPNLKKAMLAIEDQRFYDHEGIDIIRVAGAAVANIKEGRTAQGGSTITQQLARMSFLTPNKTYTRKLQEVVLAALIENEYSKDQILELYLNKVYFGAGLYGAEAASLGYFGKHASELNVAEAAMLAGLVKAPSNYAPTVNLERAVQRRNLVLQMMRDNDDIDEATYDKAKAAKVVLVDALRKEEPYGRYFKEQVRLELIQRFGEGRVYEGGLRVYTTVDLDMQRAADAEVHRALADLDKRVVRRKRQTPQQTLQAAVVSLDPATGEVRALVGGRDFLKSNFNRAMQAKRQPGSAFKPFVYAAALEAGFTPATVIDRLDEPIDTVQGAWVPEDGHNSASAMTMRAALKTSSNRAAVRMLEDLGVRKAVDYAEKVGMSDMPSVPSLALGAGEVTLESLTSAYAVFASGGIRRTPVYIRRVEDNDGNVLFTAPDVWNRVITEQTSFLMSHMLADVINHGTGWKARELGFRLPAAGKTGTTNEYRDAWFVGYTPSLVTGVWVGFDQPDTIMGGGYAAEVAVPLWAGYMKRATRDAKPEWYKAPKGITAMNVCRLSGKRPVDSCWGSTYVSDEGYVSSASSVYTEYFVRGTEPSEACPVHGGRSIYSRVAGWVGGGETPHVPRQERAVIDGYPTAEPPVHADVPPQAQTPDMAPEPPKKKRGFWSRVFGVGSDESDEEKRIRQQREREQKELEKQRKREQRERERNRDRDRDDNRER